MEVRRKFTAARVRDAIEDDAPSKRTVRNTLDAMVEMEFLGAKGGAGSAPREYYPLKNGSSIDPGGYTPRNVTPSSTIPYPGGKAGIAEWIIENMPTHDTYVEVFGGSAGVLFSKSRSKYEIYNDVNDDLTQFFRVVRDRSDDLATWLSSVPYSRSQYEEWVTEFYKGYRPDDPIERAGRFFSLRYMQYLGVLSTANGFKTRARRSPARTFDNAKARIHSLTERFEQVTIESLDYQEVIKMYDDSKVNVLFYVDPPYVDTENQYVGEFDHGSLVEYLQQVDNDWMLSCKQVPDGLPTTTVKERKSRHRMKRQFGTLTEKLVCNFDLSDRPKFQ
ncbi:DNA adenine methylase [Natronosalvus amylolyticus]|uniref:DNA adenine methylase n=1 Tax=Natronosalvus amylolyticus TaxID=2961994 RepID=UPI0020C9719B|nr:DNA adenine methylase [Natronosalvus amylolyticus]